MTTNFPALIKSQDNGKYILMFDASAYSESNCMKNIEYKIIHGLGGGRKCHKMEYGTAFHKALAEYYMSGDINKSLQIAATHIHTCGIEFPEDDYRTSGHLIMNLQDYFKHYEFDDSIKVKDSILEKKFSLPIYSDDLCEILISGTIDMINPNYGGRLIVDHKTFARFGSSVMKLESYQFSPQLMLYRMIYEILFPAEAGRKIGCQINGIELVRPLVKTPRAKNGYMRSDIFYYSDEQMKDFRRHLENTVKEIAVNFQRLVNLDEEFPRNYTQCDGKYSLCRFSTICRAPITERGKVIQDFYQVERYNPLRFQE